jgi:hypothetical protein
MNSSPQTILGLKVIISPDIPKMQLGPGDYVTPEFRAEIDDWLRVFFGTTNLIDDNVYLMSEAFGSVHMNPRTWIKMKGATK